MAGFKNIQRLMLGVGEEFVIIWVIVACLASFAGWTFEISEGLRARDWIGSWNFKWITGPKIYLDFFWAYLWIFRVSMVCSYFWVNSKKVWKIWKIYFCDACISLMFFPVYMVVLEVYAISGFKISGHCFLLSLALWMLRREGEVSVVILRMRWVKVVTICILAYHYFILFFTCFAYHTFLEISAGSFLGVFLTQSIQHLLNTIPINLT
jgi:hypothetical protein